MQHQYILKMIKKGSETIEKSLKGYIKKDVKYHKDLIKFMIYFITMYHNSFLEMIS